jgi:hypothetical protein
LPKGVVKGEVTVDGGAVKTGLIKFIPVDGQTPSADAIITDGKYTGTVPLGDKRIEITASRVKGKKRMLPDSPEEDDIEEIPLPERYNVKSELTLKVERGEQTKNFELKSK